MRGLVIPLLAILALLVAPMVKSDPAPQEIKYFWLTVYTYDLPSGLLSDGVHTYQNRFQYTVPNPGSLVGRPHKIQVSSQAPIADRFMLLRPAGAQGLNSVGECVQFKKVNPKQPVKFMVAWLPDVKMTEAEIKAQVQSMKATVQWDDQQPVVLTPQTTTTSWDALWNCRPWVNDLDPHKVTALLVH